MNDAHSKLYIALRQSNSKVFFLDFLATNPMIHSFPCAARSRERALRCPQFAQLACEAAWRWGGPQIPGVNWDLQAADASDGWLPICPISLMVKTCKNPMVSHGRFSPTIPDPYMIRFPFPVKIFPTNPLMITGSEQPRCERPGLHPGGIGGCIQVRTDATQLGYGQQEQSSVIDLEPIGCSTDLNILKAGQLSLTIKKIAPRFTPTGRKADGDLNRNEGRELERWLPPLGQPIDALVRRLCSQM